MSKRKAFNFYVSYFDTFNELSDKDKLKFITALLNKQFLGIEPELTGIAKLAYNSQKHSINQQVEGYENKTKTKLNKGGFVGGAKGGLAQEKEEEKEKEKEENNNQSIDWSGLISVFNSITGKKTRVVNDKAKKQIKARLKEGYKKKDISTAIKNCYNDDFHKQTNHKHLTLEFISRADKLDKFLSTKEVSNPNYTIGKDGRKLPNTFV